MMNGKSQTLTATSTMLMWTWDGWDGDSEFTWGEGDGDTITTAASIAADSLNSEGSSHYEGAHFGERSFDFSEDSPQTE